MKSWIKELAVGFSNNNIKLIKEKVLEFAAKITKAILDNNIQNARELVQNARTVRDNVEFDKEIERNKEFYFGYLYAYENFTRKYLDYNKIDENINCAIKYNSNLRNIIETLGDNGALRQKDLANMLGLTSNNLANVVNTEIVKTIDVINKVRIGKNSIYSLNSRGRKYYNNSINGNKKNYDKDDILEILKYINSDDVNTNNLKGSIIDKEITDEITKTKSKINKIKLQLMVRNSYKEYININNNWKIPYENINSTKNSIPNDYLDLIA